MVEETVIKLEDLSDNSFTTIYTFISISLNKIEPIKEDDFSGWRR